MSDEPISVGELSRQVRDVLLRFQTLAERLDQSYMSKEVFDLWQRLINGEIAQLQIKLTEAIETAKRKADADDLTTLKLEKANTAEVSGIDNRVKSLEDNQKWVVRLVLSLIIVAVITGVLITSGSGP